MIYELKQKPYLVNLVAIDKAKKIKALDNFKITPKFDAEVWQKRGLNPSPIELCNQLDEVFNLLLDQLSRALEIDSTPQQLKNLLKSTLSSLDKMNYDTEEKELICEYFDELSSIVKVGLKKELSNWLYGFESSELSQISKKQALMQEKLADILKQSCQGCDISLETKILEKQEGIPENWIIAKCNYCNTINLIALGKNIKGLKIVNYQPIEFFNDESSTYEDVVNKLEAYKTST